MKIYDYAINRDQNWGWFDNYAKDFIRKTFGEENIKDYSSGTLAWKYCSFNFALRSGGRFEGRFTYSECMTGITNHEPGMLEIFKIVYNRDEGKLDLIPYENE